MKTSALFCLFASLLLALPSAAQGPAAQEKQGGSEKADEEKSKAEEEEAPRRFWQAAVPGGHYMVAIDRIASISMHEYVLDGQLVVNEMVIDTNGRGLARFYHVISVAESSDSPVAARLAEKGHELLDRAGQKAGTDIHDMAQKNYPTTSHAGMIEYRILDLPDLKALYRSLQNAWETGKGRKITLK